jgi:hypothetical protein
MPQRVVYPPLAKMVYSSKKPTIKKYLSGNPPSGGGKEHDDRSNILNLGQFAIHTCALVVCDGFFGLSRIKEGTNKSVFSGELNSIRIHWPRSDVVDADSPFTEFLGGCATEMLDGSLRASIGAIEPRKCC